MVDGREWRAPWKDPKFYDLHVDGDFLVFNGGRSLVTEVDEKWSVIRDIEDERSPLQAIIDRVEGEPLILLEDKVEQKNFFLHRDRLLDDTGRELFTVRAARDHTDRLRQVTDFVVSRRAARP